MTEAASNAKAALAEADASLRVIQLLEESIKREHKFHRLFTEYTVTPNLQKSEWSSLNERIIMRVYSLVLW